MTDARRTAAMDRAVLEEERDFLLRSLDDLEREYDAGDIDEADYAALRDDYTARAADVLRTLDARAARRVQPATPKRRVVAWTAGVVAFAVLAGVLVAFASGRRDDGSVASGDSAQGAAENIAQADQLMSADKLDEAIAAYTKALDDQPSNVRALTYRGWLYFQTDDVTRAWADLDAAVAIDQSYPDAHVFRSIIFTRDKKWTDAYREYKAIDVARAPRDVVELLVGSRLQPRILSALVAPVLAVTNPPPQAADGSSGGFSAEEIRIAADQIAEEGRVLDALKLLDRLPNDPKVIATRAWITGRLGQQLLDAGKQTEGQQYLGASRKDLDTAVTRDPNYLPARVYRSFVALAQNLPKDADADLKVFEAAKEQPVELQMLVSQSGLRKAIDDALKR
jgi:tetratricopeptide (TPR) repeat protein